MASVSPFPCIINQPRVQIFRCTRVFNHLLPSGHERQACQSNPSSTRRLNRGSFHTPKFSLLLLKTFHTSILKDFTRVDQPNPLLGNQPKLGFDNSQIKGTSNISCGHHASSYASKNLHVKFQALQVKFPQTIAQMGENQLYWSKSQLWSTYSQTS